MKRFVFDTADTDNVTRISHGEWSLNLNHQITCTKLVVTNVIIPHTFYNVNTTNNKFVLINALGEETVELPVQYMNGNDLANFTFNGINIKWEKKFWKFGFTVPSDVLGIKFTTSFKLFGFEKNKIYDTSTTKTLVSPFVADLNSIPAIYIRCNQIHSKFIYNNNRTSILHRLPVNLPFGQLLTYQNNSTDMFINQENINYLQFTLTDNKGEHIDLNNADWKLELLLID